MNRPKWKKYMVSAAALALVGAGAVGSGTLDLDTLSGNTESIEAAATPISVNIVAFDQYVMLGTPYDALDNVTAFGVVDGSLINMSDNVTAVSGEVDINTPGQYELTYEAETADGDIGTRTIQVTVGIDPSESIQDYLVVLNDLGGIIDRAGIDDDERADIQSKIDLIREDILQTHVDFNEIDQIVNGHEGDINTLRDELLPLQDRLDEVYSATVNLYESISGLQESFAIHKALAETELARLNLRLESEAANHEAYIDALTTRIDETADAEQVDALTQAVDDSIAQFEALEERIASRVAEVTAELDQLDRLDAQSEGRDQIVLKLIERNETEISELEEQIESIVAEREAKLTALSEKFDGKLDQADLDELKAEQDALNDYYETREEALTGRLSTLQSETENLVEQEAQYAERLNQLRDKLVNLRDRERDVEERISNELNLRQEVREDLDDVDGITDEVVDNVVDEIVNGGLKPDEEEVNDETADDTPVDNDEIDETGDNETVPDSDNVINDEDVSVDNDQVDEEVDDRNDTAEDESDDIVDDTVEEPVTTPDNSDVESVDDTPNDTPDSDDSVDNGVEDDDQVTVPADDVDIDDLDEEVDPEDIEYDDDQTIVGGEDLASDGITIHSGDVSLSTLLGLDEETAITPTNAQAPRTRIFSGTEEEFEVSSENTLSSAPDGASDKSEGLAEVLAVGTDDESNSVGVSSNGGPGAALSGLLEDGVDADDDTAGIDDEAVGTQEGGVDAQEDERVDVSDTGLEVGVDLETDDSTDEVSVELDVEQDEQDDRAVGDELVTEEGTVETDKNGVPTDEETLPQTGAAYGAITTAGVGIVSALGAFIMKRRRDK